MLVLVQTTLFPCKEHCQWYGAGTVAWILCPLCRQSLLMSSMGPWKTWSGFKPSQTWPKKLHFWSLDNHLCFIRLVTHQLNYLFGGLVGFFAFFFPVSKYKNKEFPIFSSKSGPIDIQILPQYSPLSLWSAFYVLRVVYFSVYLAMPRNSAVFSLAVLEAFWQAKKSLKELIKQKGLCLERVYMGACVSILSNPCSGREHRAGAH